VRWFQIVIAAMIVTLAAILLVPVWLLWAQTIHNGLVENGVQKIWICGEKRTESAWTNPLYYDVTKNVRGSNKGLWSVDERGNYDVYLHYSQAGTD
jgi:hypothetical protein